MSQTASQLVSVGEWRPDDDFPIFPVGSKPKRAVFSPPAPAQPFLIPDHRYLFKISSGWRIFQHWSEVIAFEVAKLGNVPAAPCFIAVDERSKEVGVVSEFFYGHPGSKVLPRLVSGADIMKRAIRGYDEKTGHQHNVITNMRTSAAYKVPDHEVFWGKIFAFDALIGNTDRHPENWGFLVELASGLPGSRLNIKFAPSFDHGTSLGYGTAESNLAKETVDARLESYISHGRHHIRWTIEDEKSAGHFALCKRFAESYPNAVGAMRQVAAVSMDELARVVDSFTYFKLVDGALSPARADYLLKLIGKRREALEAALV